MTINEKGRYVREDLTGLRSGNIVALRFDKKTPNGGSKWVCRCNCGNEFSVWAECVKRRSTQNCRPCRNKLIAKARTIHGHAINHHRAPEYKIWVSMKNRCLNENSQFYHHYGGRGITVHEEWRHSFVAFLRDVGRRPKGYSLDRIDNSKGYLPGNVRWATPRTQSNNRRSNHLITFKGETKTMSDWARVVGIGISTIHHRLVKGWSVERALTTIPIDCSNDFVKK